MPRGFSDDETYKSVTGNAKAFSKDAVLFDHPDLDEPVWIAKSTMSHASVERCADADKGDEITLDVMEWVLRKHGLD